MFSSSSSIFFSIWVKKFTYQDELPCVHYETVYVCLSVCPTVCRQIKRTSTQKVTNRFLYIWIEQDVEQKSYEKKISNQNKMMGQKTKFKKITSIKKVTHQFAWTMHIYIELRYVHKVMKHNFWMSNNFNFTIYMLTTFLGHAVNKKWVALSIKVSSLNDVIICIIKIMEHNSIETFYWNIIHI